MDKSFCIQILIDHKSNIPPLAFNCSYAGSVINKNAESTYDLRNPLTSCGIRFHLRIPHTNFADSNYFFDDSTYISRNPLTVAESRTTSYICLLRNPQQNKCADKVYVTGICMRNLLKFCLWNPLTF